MVCIAYGTCIGRIVFSNIGLGGNLFRNVWVVVAGTVPRTSKSNGTSAAGAYDQRLGSLCVFIRYGVTADSFGTSGRTIMNEQTEIVQDKQKNRRFWALWFSVTVLLLVAVLLTVYLL